MLINPSHLPLAKEAIGDHISKYLIIPGSIILATLLLYGTGCGKRQPASESPLSEEKVKATAQEQISRPVLDIPRLENIQIDGLNDDWKGAGLKVEMLSPDNASLKSASDQQAGLSFGWNDEGLLITMKVRDNSALEVENLETLWQGDSVEVFLGTGFGKPDLCQWVISPGMDPTHPEPRTHLYDYRKDPALKGISADIKVARTKIEDGWQIEALLPWNALRIKPTLGMEIISQVVVNDADRPEKAGQKDAPTLYSATWYPGRATWKDTTQAYSLRLADKANPVYHLYGRIQAATPTEPAHVQLLATSELKGKKVIVRRGTQSIFEGELKNDPATGHVSLDIPILDGQPEELSLEVNGFPAEIQFTRSKGYGHLNKIATLYHRPKELTDEFGLNRPWDKMQNAPLPIRRHRGMVAAAYEWLREDCQLERLIKYELLMEVTRIIDDARAGRDTLSGKRGEFMWAYYSPVDMSGQYFVISLPATYDPAKTYPLVVWLHGNGQRPMPGLDPQPHDECIIVKPWGRGDLRFKGLGESDVMDVIGYMQDSFKIDPNRIYLTGLSMGGGGSWTLGSQRASTFAAIAPELGFGNGLPLENLVNCPVLNQHGGKDWLVATDLSRQLFLQVQKKGYSAIHKEYSEAGHFIPKDGLSSIDWMKQFVRPEKPESIIWTCETPENGSAYWLKVCEIPDPHAQAKVRARAVVSSTPSLGLSLENISVLEIDLGHSPFDRKKDLMIQANLTLLTCQAPLPEKLYILNSPEGVKTADTWQAPEKSVRPYRAGAVLDLYAGNEPLMIVYGTKGGEARTKALKAAAGKLSLHGGLNRYPMIMGRIPIKADTDLTPEEMEHFNLIILGGARDNALTDKLMPSLPVKITSQGELVIPGRNPVPLKQAGWSLYYHNPLAPKRLIFIRATDESDAKAEDWYGRAGEQLNISWINNRIDEADLTVSSFDGSIRSQRQFENDWQWRDLPGVGVKIPKTFATYEGFTLASLNLARRMAHTDLAMGPGLRKGNPPVLYDANHFTAADLATKTSPTEYVRGVLTGAQLSKVLEKSLPAGEVLLYPSLNPAKLEPEKKYSLVLPTHFISKLGEVEVRLEEMEPAVMISAKSIQDEIFAPKQ